MRSWTGDEGLVTGASVRRCRSLLTTRVGASSMPSMTKSICLRKFCKMLLSYVIKGAKESLPDRFL